MPIIVMGDSLMVIVTPVIKLQGDCEEAVHLTSCGNS